ncbi:MAG: conserved exported protein of unknown function [Nitrosopumilales archaeon]|nr:MAG: conserved exported protein of unknown function [Nitrosopumilales archaeon]
MKTKYALMGILVAGLVGAGLASASLTTPLFLASTQTSNVEYSPMMGHITVIAYDANGDIKSYLQTDNQIVNVGENCTAEVLFNIASGGSQPCAGIGGSHGGHGPATGGFTWLGIGETATAADSDQTALVLEASETRLNATANGGVTVTQDATGAGAGTKSIISIVDQFTMGGPKTINEFGLFDAVTGGNMFARQTTGGTALSGSDTLQVTWTIDVGA